ncbi:unnamed protein product [Citrullus colocynthis]|uniref:Uncharacterized protein n=1 Tax=Citrullus colocynthis TaxID=252529 RepID=A0ABP0Z9B0_9ROSI
MRAFCHGYHTPRDDTRGTGELLPFNESRRSPPDSRGTIELQLCTLNAEQPNSHWAAAGQVERRSSRVLFAWDLVDQTTRREGIKGGQTDKLALVAGAAALRGRKHQKGERHDTLEA